MVARLFWRPHTLACVLAVTAAGSTVLGQPRITVKSFQTLRSDVAQVRQMRGIRDVRARWMPLPSAQRALQPAAMDRITVLGSRTIPGALRRERRPELSGDRLVIVSVDRNGRELDWRMIPNPRVLRAELPGPGGTLTGGPIETADADLEFAIPDLPEVDRVEIYQPRWNGSEFILTAVGVLPLDIR